jgi:hypothetical protein
MGFNWDYNLNWMSNSDPCDINLGWYGVSCELSEYETDYLYVKSLFLSQNNLQGTLPTTLQNLSHLQSLVLDHNLLEGTLPTFQSLSALSWLYLSSNKLSGTISSNLASSSTKLVSLSMADNFLSGTISSSLYLSLPNLHHLDLSHNNLTSYLADAVCNVNFFKLDGNDWFCPLPSCCGRSSKQMCGLDCLSNYEYYCCWYLSNLGVKKCFCNNAETCPVITNYTLIGSFPTNDCENCDSFCS